MWCDGIKSGFSRLGTIVVISLVSLIYNCGDSDQTFSNFSLSSDPGDSVSFEGLSYIRFLEAFTDTLSGIDTVVVDIFDVRTFKNIDLTIDWPEGEYHSMTEDTLGFNKYYFVWDTQEFSDGNYKMLARAIFTDDDTLLSLIRSVELLNNP